MRKLKTGLDITTISTYRKSTFENWKCKNWIELKGKFLLGRNMIAVNDADYLCTGEIS